MAHSSRIFGEAADSETIDLSSMTIADASEDAPVVLDLTLEEDTAANLDHFILLSRQGFFEEADSFFDAYLRKHAAFFPVVWEYCNCKTIKNRHFDPASDEFLDWASGAHVYDSEDTALLNLIVNGATSLDDSLERLRHSLQREEMRDIDVRTAATFVAH
jgi:hypothetical protein